MSNTISYILLVATIVALQQLPYSCTSVTGNFIEIPSPVTIEVNNGMEMDAVFRCRHQRIDAGINWLINGSSSRLYPDIDNGFIRESNGMLIDTLTIPAIPEYNGAEVVCFATFFDGSPHEVTPPANLIIIVIMVTAEATTQPPPPITVEPSVTPEATIQPPPITTMEPGFVMTPSSLNKTVEQGEAVFRCQHRSSDAITWRVNGSSLSSSNISEWRVPVDDGGFGSFLSIATLPGFNNTTIECGAIFFDSSPLLFTPPVTLLVQGIPGNISNLGFERNYSSGILTTFWDPLPTLDITDIDPDIVYNVQIFKATCGQSVLMSDENVTESIINNSLSPLELMEIYMAVITPRNNVPGYVDGPRREMKEKFMSLNGMTLFELSRRPLGIVISINPVPRYYTMMLESVDGTGSNMLVNISMQRDGEMVTMQIGEPLPSRRLWSALILPYDCVVDMQVTELSTHDIQNIKIIAVSSHPGQISIMGNFIDGSTATGVLLIVYSLTNESDIHYHVINKLNEQNNNININVTGLTVADIEYGVSVFAMENGLPFPRVVTLPTNITVSFADNTDRETIPQPPMSVEYELRYPTSTCVCITCTFLDSSTTDCVAVVHQRISQLSSSGLMNIESSHKFTRSDDTAYGCIEGVNLEQYQVGVVGGSIQLLLTKHNKQSSGCGVTCITSSATAPIAILLILVVSIVLTIICRRYHKRVEGSSPEAEIELELHKCSAYEIVKLSRQRVEMENNPAYGEVGQFHRE